MLAKCAACPASCIKVVSAVFPLPTARGSAKLVKLVVAGCQVLSALRHAGWGQWQNPLEYFPARTREFGERRRGEEDEKRVKSNTLKKKKRTQRIEEEEKELTTPTTNTQGKIHKCHPHYLPLRSRRSSVIVAPL